MRTRLQVQHWAHPAYPRLRVLPQCRLVRLAFVLACVAGLSALTRAPRSSAQPATLILGTWVQAQPTLSPVGRVSAALAGVPAAKSVLLFGGEDGAHRVLDDTWTWSGFTDTWTQRQPAARPHARCCAGMVYDAQTGTTVLFGGADAKGQVSGDTWIWDGANWMPSVSAAGPSARSDASMVYDEARHIVVLFGGTDENGNLLNDTWTWDGTNWTQAQPAVSPPARTGAAFAYDAFASNAVLFAGCCAAGVDPRTGPYLADTWTWDGANWTAQQPVSSPPARTAAALAYDPILASLLLFGGCSGTNSCHLADTWLWDGSNWTQQQPPAMPAGRAEAALATDSATNTVLLFGGSETDSAGNASFGADTWTWVPRLPAAEPPAGP